MPPIIQSLWIGADLSNVEKLCVKSFLDHGHEFHLYTYGHIGGVPKGAVIKDANEILPEREIFRNNRGGFANFSDWFRYTLLNKRGNFWVDMDVVCIRPFSFDLDVVFGRGVVGDGFGSAVIALPNGHILADSMEKACRDYSKVFPWDDLTDRIKKSKRRWSGQGKEGAKFDNPGSPGGLTKAIKYFDLIRYAKPFMYFYPIHFSLWQSAFNDAYIEGAGFYENTYAVHLWNEMSRNTPGFDKNARFDEASLFEQLKKKHGIENNKNAPRIRNADVRAVSSLERRRAENKKRRRKILAVFILGVAFIAGWVAGR